MLAEDNHVIVIAVGSLLPLLLCYPFLRKAYLDRKSKAPVYDHAPAQNLQYTDYNDTVRQRLQRFSMQVHRSEATMRYVGDPADLWETDETVFSFNTSHGGRTIRYTSDVLAKNSFVMTTNTNLFGMFTLALNPPPVDKFRELSNANETLPDSLHHFALFMHRVLPMCVVAVQLSFVALVAWYQALNQRTSAGGAPLESRLTAFAIALIYFVRLMGGALSFYSTATFIPWSTWEVDGLRRQTLEDGGYMPGAALDWHYNLLLHKGILFFNLWVVFHSNTVLDMVLSSLAVEVIARLDDEYKARIFAATPGFEIYARHLMEKGMISNVIAKELGLGDAELVAEGIWATNQLWKVILSTLLPPVLMVVMMICVPLFM